MQGGSGRVLRRRLTAPAPTPLRTQTQPVEDDEGNADEIDGVQNVVTEDEARMALVPSPSGSTTAGQTDSPPVPDISFVTYDGWFPLAFLFFKVGSLTLPCAPYLCSATVLYPLFSLAGLDLMLYPSLWTH
jgi:hypothetical protein